MAFPHRVETDRLVLSRLEGRDREAFARVWADPDVWRALRGDRPFDAEFAARRFEHHVRHWEEHGFGVFGVCEHGGGELAGWAGPAHPSAVPELSSEVEVGWTLRRPFWGRGLAREGAAGVFDAAFAELGRDELISLIAPANARSIAVAEGLGMSPRPDVQRTEEGDVLVVYSLTRASWRRRAV